MGYYKNLKKFIAITVIIAFAFQSDIFLHSQRKDEFKRQFDKAKEAYINGQYDSSEIRLERTISIIKEKKLERKNILGQCYLLLGAIYEKKGESLLAEENYRRAKEEYGVVSIEGVNFDNLEIYKRVVKGEIEIDKIFEKARDDYNNGQYVNSKTRLEQTIGTLKSKGLDRKDILGKCYLLLGAIYEKEEKTRLAEKHYNKAKKEYGIQSVEGVRYLENLTIYKRVVKGIIEHEGEKRKKKFPWLLVAGGVIVVVVIAVLILKKKKKYTLTVTRGEGVDGSPISGSSEYKKGRTVSYSYSLQSGYTNLVVRLDGTEVSASGTITMDRNHTLTATALNQYTLTVTKGEGVDGTPDSGTTPHAEGSTINYSYSLQSGYTDLVVQLDGATVAASGTITMNSNHTLTASASINRPVVSITSHSNGQIVSRSINILVDVQSEVSIDRVELFVNNNLINTDRDSPYSLRWDTRTVADGLYTVKAVAYDSENVSGEAQISLVVNNEGGLTVQITSPQNNEIVKGTCTILVTATSDVGIDRVVFYVDGSQIGEDSSEPYSMDWDTSTYFEGAHTIRVVAYDNANRNAVFQITVTVSR